jgi:hypothetical protein
MYPVLSPALFRYRRDRTVALHIRRIGVTLPLRAKRHQQARRQHRPRSRQRHKDKKSGCAAAASSILPSSSATPRMRLRFSCALTFTTAPLA